MPAACPGGRRGDGLYSTQAAAELLNVNRATVWAWCKSGRLEAIQEAPKSPLWVKLTPEIISQLRKPNRKRGKRRSSE
jgi:hypothetical protein